MKEAEEEETEEWNAEGERVYINQHPLAGGGYKGADEEGGPRLRLFYCLVVVFHCL